MNLAALNQSGRGGMNIKGWRAWLVIAMIAIVIAAVAFIAGVVAPSLASDAYGGAARYLAENGEGIAAVALVLQAIIFIVSARYAYNLYRETKETAARNNTLQLIFEEHTDRDVAAQRKMYRNIRDDEFDRLENYDDVHAHKARDREKWKPPPCLQPCTPTQYHAWIEEKWREHWKEQEENWRERQDAIIAVMNRYEAFAIGIQTGAVDAAMYKRWWKSQLIRDWHALRKLVDTLQRKSPNAYIEFQALAEKWQEEDTKERQQGK